MFPFRFDSANTPRLRRDPISVARFFSRDRLACNPHPVERPTKRMTIAPRRKQEAVLRRLRGEPVALLSRQLGVEVKRFEASYEKARWGMEMFPKARKGLRCRRWPTVNIDTGIRPKVTI